MTLLDSAQAAKAASTRLLALSERDRQRALRSIAHALRSSAEEILIENQRDLAANAQLGEALRNRLTLTKESIEAMARALESIAAAPQVVGQIVSETRRPDGLVIQKQRIPLGVIAMIFESRPNVVVDGAALAIKSGNAIILKGGKEAQHSNRVLFDLIQTATTDLLPAGSITLVETREAVDELLKLNAYVDLVVPRGGEALIRHVRQHATMPVVAHDRGLCHIYVHHDAREDFVKRIVVNAKTQRPGVCNAMETLLVHRDFSRPLLVELLGELAASGVVIHACENSRDLVPGLVPAAPEDWNTEWLALAMNLKLVASSAEALAHIQRYGSHHTEALLTEDPRLVEEFLNHIDASCLAINASTRFNDGGELGLGAELGISTSKLHAYGPMGAQEMTTTRFVVTGTGHIRN